MFRFFLATSLIFSAHSLADDLVTLKSGDTFTGEVLSLSDGLITLKSPLSDVPLKVKNEKLQRLKFDKTSTDDLPKNSQVMNLRNGDTLPGEVVGLSDTHVSFQTWFAGQLEIPREQIESIYFGVTPQTTLYRGPNGLAGWDQGNDQSWEFDNGRLLSKSRGAIGKDFNLPNNFIFSTRFIWNSSPNFRIHLCSDAVTAPGDAGSNSYLLYINTSGVQIKRVIPSESGKTEYKTLITYLAQLRDENSSSLDIELRIDRSSRLLKLTINGEEIAPGYDPYPAPTGGHIVFESLNSGRRDSRIEDIHLQEWDAKTQRFRSEPRADETSDTLTQNDGDRFSGKIIGYDLDAEDKIFEIKVPQSDLSIKVPTPHCSVMYFSRNDSLPESSGEYRLDLRSGGSLTISDIQLGAEFLDASHPWLGKMSLDRRIMSSIGKGKKANQ